MSGQHLELPITGMTCASCANRIERKLNTLDGVSATVNYATERATVDYDTGAVQPEQLVAAVEAAGYAATLPQAPDAATAEPEDETAALRRRGIAAGDRRFGTGKDRLIAGLLDGLDQPLGRDRGRVVVDGRALGRVVDRRLDAGDLVETLLDARRARRAGHPGDRQAELLSGHDRPPRGPAARRTHAR